jgi:hypothetical protein
MSETENTGVTTTIEFEVNVEKKSATGDVLDRLSANAKLTKADAGRAGYNSEEWLTVTVEEGDANAQLPKVTVNSHSKLTKADAG